MSATMTAHILTLAMIERLAAEAKLKALPTYEFEGEAVLMCATPEQIRDMEARGILRRVTP
jgi:hypothetical protein